MNYLTRPVFQFPINWSDPVNKSFQYDLREQVVGFGASYFAGLADYVVQGYSLSLWLQNDLAIQSYDTFTAALSGRLVGFWLPTLFESLQILSFTSGTVFVIKYQDLVSTWSTHPDIYLYFDNGNGSPVAAKILSVVNNGGITETVTIDASIASVSGVLSSLFVYRLHYVRMAGDTETATFRCEGGQTRQVKVIELPEEYAAVETGAQKIFLYHFWCSAPMNFDWYFTNFAGDIISEGITWSTFNMEHKSLKRSMKLQDEELDIEAQYDPAHPFSLYLPVPFSRPLFLQIFETTYGDVDVRTSFFNGRIISVSDQGEKLTGKADSFAYLLKNKLPGPLLGPTCPYCVYDQNCKAVRAAFETQASINTIDNSDIPPTVRVTFQASYAGFPQLAEWKTANWFAGGFLEDGDGVTYELRVITASSWDAVNTVLVLTLNVEMVHAQRGDIVQLIAGCDGDQITCETKFNNRINYGGADAVPVVNPSLDSFVSAVNKGGKK